MSTPFSLPYTLQHEPAALTAAPKTPLTVQPDVSPLSMPASSLCDVYPTTTPQNCRAHPHFRGRHFVCRNSMPDDLEAPVREASCPDELDSMSSPLHSMYYYSGPSRQITLSLLERIETVSVTYFSLIDTVSVTFYS